MAAVQLSTLLCLLAATSAVSELPFGQRTSWKSVSVVTNPVTRTSQSTTVLRRVQATTKKPDDFRSSPLDLGPPPDSFTRVTVREERRIDAQNGSKVVRAPAVVEDNSLRNDGVLMINAAGEGKETKKKKQDDDDDEDKKTLSQQIADGKYGLIQKEIYSRPSLRPGIISYKNNPEVPRDTDKTLGGLEEEEIWLAEDHVLVLRGGWFPNHSYNKTEPGSIWPPIDDYKAPPRQVKIPAKPKVPPPFPVQLSEGGPTEFLGPNGTKSQHPFPPPYLPPPGNFPPGAGFYPPPGNGSLYPPLPPPYPFPPPRNGSYPPPPQNYFPPQGNYPPPQENYPYPPENGPYPPFPYPPPPHGYMPFPNGSTPFGPLPPFLPPLPPGAAFLPPPGNQTEFDEDDPSIYYPPPYDFFYPRDNSTEVPPGPLVPGIILPPPPNFFAPLDDNKLRPTNGKRPQRPPTTTPQPYLPYGSYQPSPKPNLIPHSTPAPPYDTYLPQSSPSPKPPHNTLRPNVAYLDISTPLPPQVSTHPPSSTPYGAYLPGANRPTVKRPYLTYVPVTTAVRKKKPKPSTTTPKDQYEIADPQKPVEFTTTPISVYSARPSPPHFVSPQNVQVHHKGESPITSRPYFLDIDNVVTSTPDPIYKGDHVDTTPRPNYESDGLSKLKDILYTSPRPTISYELGTVIDIDTGVTTGPKPDKEQQYVTTLPPTKSVESTTVRPGHYYSDITKRPIYVKDIDDHRSSTVKYGGVDPSGYEGNSVGPTRQSQRGRGNKVVTTTPASQYYEYQPQRTPKTTYYFYEEPHYEQGYVRDITTAKPYVYEQPKWQYDNRPAAPPRQNNYKIIQSISRPQSAEELLLAQIVETLRQPGDYIYNNQNNQQSQQAPAQNYYNTGGNGQNYYQNSRPNGFVYSTQRPAYYVTRKPDYYSILQSESPLKYNNYDNSQNYPYNYEDIVQSTEHPLPQRYNTLARPQQAQQQNNARPSRLRGPGANGNTSPKTVYEFSFQKQSDSTRNYASRPTERPRPQGNSLPPAYNPPNNYQRPASAITVVQPPVLPTHAPLPSNSVEAQYYDDVTPTTRPKYKNYRVTTPSPQQHLLPVVQTATPDPLQHFYTPQDDSLLDDITKKYFTIFGQKLPPVKNDANAERPSAGHNYDNVPMTTPLPPTRGGSAQRYPSPQHQPPRLENNENQPSSQTNYVSENAHVPLHNDILVNYLHPRPSINPDSEFVDTNNAQRYQQEEDDSSKGGELVSYQLPGNGGGHVYFVTPQVAATQDRVANNGGYAYPVPQRRFRTLRNKAQQS